MTRAIPGSIVISRNPVTQWESFSRTFPSHKFAGYSDTNRSEGGYWDAKFTIFDKPSVLREMFANGLGRDVKVWGYGAECLHEGFIYEMTYNFPPDQYMKTMSSITNTLWMRADYDADDTVERSTSLVDQDSIDRFGTIERVISGGQLNSLGVADQAVQTYLNIRAWPKSAVRRGSGNGEPSLSIVAKGYIETLNWTVFNNTDAGTQALSSQVADVLADAEFVSAVEYDSNSTVVSQVVDADRKRGAIITGLSRLGDSLNNRWIVYMKFGRVVVLKQAAPVSV